MKWMKMPCIKVGGDCLDFKMLDIVYWLSIIEELNLILKSYVPLPTPSISFLATPIFPNSYSILCLNSCLLFILFWLNISHIIWMNRCCLQSNVCLGRYSQSRSGFMPDHPRILPECHGCLSTVLTLTGPTLYFPLPLPTAWSQRCRLLLDTGQHHKCKVSSLGLQTNSTVCFLS